MLLQTTSPEGEWLNNGSESVHVARAVRERLDE